MGQYRLLGVALSLTHASSANAFVVTQYAPSTPSTCRGQQWRPNYALEERRYGVGLLFTSSAENDMEVDVEGSAEDNEDGDEDFDMPWGDLQSFALRDNLPKYIVTIPVPGKKGKYGTFALWRSLLNECTELAGYDVEFVRRRYEEDVKTREDWKGYQIGNAGAGGGTAPGVLPLLESFEFHPDGGVEGLSYGLPGIANGSRIRTPAVTDIESTVIIGYIRTHDGSAAYELGTPAGDLYSEDIRRNMLENVARTASTLVQSGAAGATEVANGATGSADSNLINLGGMTAMLLAGASAVGMLSHHLTVNVFWV